MKGRPRRRRPCFFKIFLPQLNSQRMTIPPAFFKYIKGVSSKRVASLTGPSKQIWKMNLVKNDNEMAFESGWKEFIKDHCLVEGDSLVFKYDGNFCFTVSVFDQTACEKEQALLNTSREIPITGKNEYDRNAKHVLPIKKVQGINKEKVVAGSISSRPRKSSRSSVDLRREAIKVETHFDIPNDACESFRSSSEMLMLKEKEDHYSPPDKDIPCPVANEDDRSAKCVLPLPVVQASPRKRKTTEDGYLVNRPILKKRKSLDNKKQKKTQVNSVPSMNRKSDATLADVARVSPKLRKTTKDDSLANKSKEKKAKSSCGRKHKELLVDMVPSLTSKITLIRKSTKSSTKFDDLNIAIGSSEVKSEIIAVEEKENHAGLSIHAVSETKPVAPLVSLDPCPSDELNTALQMARSFLSAKPFSVIVMRESYCYPLFHLSLPRPFFRKYLPKTKTDITLLDPVGRSWNVTYLCYKNRAAIRKGWGKFSTANNVRQGDACVFELVNKNVLQVHIFRGASDRPASPTLQTALENE